MKNTLPIVIICLIPMIGFSQTGPGGVGNSTSNLLWLKANTSVYTDAGTTLSANDDLVQQWNDQSGNANNVFQGTSTNRPLYKTNSINGQPVLRFDGVDDWVGLNINVPETNFSQFVVFKTIASDGAGAAITITDPLSPSAGSHDRQFGLIGNKLGHRLWNDQTITSPASFNDNSTHIASVYVGASIGGQTVYADGSSLVTGNKTSSNFGSQTSMVIGGHNAWGFLNSDIPEIIFYNVILNTAQSILVENYLASKYGLTLPVSRDKFSFDAVYGNEVAGIGMEDASNFHSEAKGSGIVTMNNASSMDPGDYLLWGHTNAAVAISDYSDVPSSESVQARMARVWRASETGEIGTVDLSFDLTALGAISASDLRLLIDKTDNGFADETVAASTILSGATSMGGNVYKFSGVNIDDSWSFTIGTVNATLPINLTSFTATSANNNVYLTWETDTETNNDYFTVEKSSDAISFESIETIIGAENSSSVLNYSSVDTAPYPGTSYYRLKQTDLNGNIFYSEINIVETNIRNSHILIYPNPATNQITIEGEEAELNELKIFSAVGMEIKAMEKIMDHNRTTVIFDTSTLSEGSYTIKTKTSTTKVYKQ